MAKRYSARVLIDGAQSVAHMPVNMQQLGCDFFVFSGHKIFAPTGIGVALAQEEMLEIMPPWQGGGSMIRNVTFEETTYTEPPAKFEAGTPNIGDAVGLGAALDYVNRSVCANIARHEHELARVRHASAFADQGAANHRHRAGEGGRSFPLCCQEPPHRGHWPHARQAGHCRSMPDIIAATIDAAISASSQPFGLRFRSTIRRTRSTGWWMSSDHYRSVLRRRFCRLTQDGKPTSAGFHSLYVLYPPPRFTARNPLASRSASPSSRAGRPGNRRRYSRSRGTSFESRPQIIDGQVHRGGNVPLRELLCRAHVQEQRSIRPRAARARPRDRFADDRRAKDRPRRNRPC